MKERNPIQSSYLHPMYKRNMPIKMAPTMYDWWYVLFPLLILRLPSFWVLIKVATCNNGTTNQDTSLILLKICISIINQNYNCHRLGGTKNSNCYPNIEDIQRHQSESSRRMSILKNKYIKNPKR